MKRPPHVFTPPVTEPIAGGLELQVTAAEPDRGGTGVVATLSLWNGTIKHTDRVDLASDVSRRRFLKRVAEAEPTADHRALTAALLRLHLELPALIQAEAAAAAPAAPAVDMSTLLAAARPLLAAPNVLDQAANTMAARGLAGETRNAKLLYLTVTSRLLGRLVSAIVKGPSSGGKSHLLKMVLALFPETAYLDFTTVSPQYLARSEHDLRHRFVVLYEAGGVAEGLGAYIMRSLLSEGRLRLGTVDRTDGEALAAQEIVKDGPTGLLTTTTRASIDPETETRALSIGITDTADQSRAILRGAAGAYTGTAAGPPDLAPWHALQSWLEVAGERRVLIPFAGRLAGLVPCTTIRIRRDFGKLLDLIAACAILHQMQRPRRADGAVEATLEDYAIVRELLAESFAAAQQDGLTPAQREAVAAVAVLCAGRGAETAADPGAGVSQAEVAKHLGLDASATSRRLANPLRAGYVVNLEAGKRGKAARYVPGDPLPPVISALPEASELEDLMVVTI